MPSTQVKPLTSRPLDLIYVIWFGLHLLTTICIDVVPLYPTALQLPVLLKIRAGYIADYKDPLVTNPPAWFQGFLWAEGLYQAPLCIYGIIALKDDRPALPLHLLLYAAQTAFTTLTCLIEIFASSQISWEEKISLTWLYSAFAVIPGLIGVDMFFRIKQKLLADHKAIKAE